MESIKSVSAFAALERTARRILDSQQADRILPEHLREKLEAVPEVEHEMIRDFYSLMVDKLDHNHEGVTRDDVYYLLEQEIAHIRSIDEHSPGILTPDETEKLSQTGQLAVKLAKRLRDQEPVPLALKHGFEGLNGEELSESLRKSSAHHIQLTYSYARCVMFSELFNKDSSVREVYSNRTIKTTGEPRGSRGTGVNTEHTWPKSRGVKNTSAYSDLHHLFPTDDEANMKRSSHPFGIVVETDWEKGGSKLGKDIEGQTVFEPVEQHRGAVARAMFYIHTIYELPFQPGEQEVFRLWNDQYPVTDEERSRNDRISKHQGNRNPFVDYPELVERICTVVSDAPEPIVA